MKYIKLFSEHNDYTDYMESENYIAPNLSYCINEHEVHFEEQPRDYSKEYLTIEALENGNVYFYYAEHKSYDTSGDKQTYIEYSKDKGVTWNRTTRTSSDAITITIPMTAGEIVYFRGDNERFVCYNEGTQYDVSRFGSDIRFNVYGNIASLLYAGNFIGQTESANGYEFQYFFSCVGSYQCLVVDASNLVLPFLSFNFQIYSGMFYNSQTLLYAPSLPSTKLSHGCYSEMFRGCTSLTTAPELPATTLAQHCYSSMFCQCSSLTTAPELPAVYVNDGAYTAMFYNCQNLSYIKAMFTERQTTISTFQWVSGVSNTGTFVKNSAAQWSDTSVNGIPTGWTVETASE